MYLGGVSTPPKFGSELPVPEGPGFGSVEEKNGLEEESLQSVFLLASDFSECIYSRKPLARLRVHLHTTASESDCPRGNVWDRDARRASR